ncbi:hypothetical protein BC827DRAFT_1304327 [Russula dissimulans]|nr:hypothetical protein BC827DRAFT_1304327 [Russula dissimulans]
MSSTATALKCPVCLDTCVDPVAPPCGHIICRSCIRLHILASPHPFLATCPTCRDVFATVMPDLDVIPQEYHELIYPPLRPIDLTDRNDHAQEAIDLLKHENCMLRDCVANLKSQKAYVTKHWLASRSTVERLKVDERDARLEVEMLKDELEETRLAVDRAKVEAYLALETEKENIRFANERLEELRAGRDAPKLR